MAESSRTATKSQNGWPASPRPSEIAIVTVAVPLSRGTKRIQVAEGAATALTEMLQWWDHNVEPVETVGGYYYREIRGYEGTGTISNHGSGTALDINASKHPLGTTGTTSTAAAIAITAKAASLGLKWGGNYRGRKDPMHVEVNFSPGATAMLTTAGRTVVRSAKVWAWVTLVGLIGLGAAYFHAKRKKAAAPVVKINPRRHRKKRRGGR